MRVPEIRVVNNRGYNRHNKNNTWDVRLSSSGEKYMQCTLFLKFF